MIVMIYKIVILMVRHCLPPLLITIWYYL